MKTSKLMLCVLGIVVVFTIAAATAADAPKRPFKFAKTNVPGALQTFPSSINNAGVTVGQYEDSSGVNHGYILKGKSLTTLDDPNGTNTNAQGINFNGAIKVVGYYTNNSTQQSMGFLYTPKNRRFKDIGPAGVKSSMAKGISDEGSIVGSYVDSSNREHGFVSHGTKYEILDVPGSLATFADDINDMGDIVLGWVDSSGAYKGALRNSRGEYTEINVPDTGPLGSFPTGINNKGEITFVWYDSSGLEHGAAYGYKFDYPKAVQTYAGGISDKNALVGSYQDKIGGPWSGYKATFK